MKLHFSTKKGFTIIETLIAIFILITAVVVPLTIASKGVFYSNVIRDQSTASYLAQEVIEFIRYQRDAQGLSATGNWAAFLTQFTNCFGANGCIIDPTETDPSQMILACSSTCPVIRLYSTSTPIAYGYKSSWASTVFIRTIRMQSFGTTDVKVSVSMQWNTSGVTRTFEVTTYLLNWQK